MVLGGYRFPTNLPDRPSAVVDGGANIGLFALCAHAIFPGIKVTCYEPDGDNLSQLRRNLAAAVPAVAVQRTTSTDESA